MKTIPLVLAWLAVGVAILIVVSNYVWSITSWQNARCGISHRPSVIPIIVLIFCAIGSTMAGGRGFPYPPLLLFAVLVALDPATWSLLALPFVLLFRRRN